jgi:hypothetical protein
MRCVLSFRGADRGTSDPNLHAAAPEAYQKICFWARTSNQTGYEALACSRAAYSTPVTPFPRFRLLGDLRQ